MDPLSITASAITLAGACASCIAGIDFIHQTIRVPHDVTGLRNELVRIQELLNAIRDATGALTSASELSLPLSHLGTALLDLESNLQWLMQICSSGTIPMTTTPTATTSASSSTLPNTNSNVVTVQDQNRFGLRRRARWLKNQKRIAAEKRKLEISRQNILFHLSLTGLQQGNLLLGRVAELRTAVSATTNLGNMNLTGVTPAPTSVVGPTSVTPDVPSTDTTVTPVLPTANDNDPPPGTSIYESNSPHNDDEANQADSSQTEAEHDSSAQDITQPEITNQDNDIPLSLELYRCIPHCKCKCHRTKNFRSPESLSWISGRFLVESMGVPSIYGAHDFSSCKRNYDQSIKLSYMCPGWLLRLAITFCLESKQSFLPSFSIECARIVSNNADVFIYVRSGNINGLKSLFTKGTASPVDISALTGNTLLHEAFYGRNKEMCHFLRGVGARLNMVNKWGVSVASLALEYHQASPVAFTAEFLESNWLEDQQFSVFHKILIGIPMPPLTLQDAIQLFPDQLETRDAHGRTPLNLASILCNTTAMKILIDAGSDLEAPDRRGRRPVHQVCRDAEDTAPLRCLMEHDIDLNCPDEEGMTPLMHAVIYQSDLDFADLMIDPSIIGSACQSARMDYMDRCGFNAASCAAYNDHAAMLEALLDRGCTVNVINVEGCSLIMDCINLGCDAAFQVLCSKADQTDLDFNFNDRDKQSFLHHLAKNGSSTMIQAVYNGISSGAMTIDGLDLYGKSVTGDTALDLIRTRRSASVMDEWQDLMDIIQLQTSQDDSEVNNEIFHDAIENQCASARD